MGQERPDYCVVISDASGQKRTSHQVANRTVKYVTAPCAEACYYSYSGRAAPAILRFVEGAMAINIARREFAARLSGAAATCPFRARERDRVRRLDEIMSLAMGKAANPVGCGHG